MFKSIPLMVTLMVISLIGIIAIQYKWIDTSIKEKQKLIDKNVILAVANVEEQLNDYRAIKFISDTNYTSFNFNQILNTSENDSFYFKNFTSIDSVIDLKVFGSSSEIDSSFIRIEEFHNLETNTDSLKKPFFQEQISQLESLANKIQIEFRTENGDMRLDSTRLKKLLFKEFTANNLGEIFNWGVFDKKDHLFYIQPKSDLAFDYSIPLFTTDVMSPSRFELRLTLLKSQRIYSDMLAMIGLSLLFILIISIVFGYSISLIVKHKKISQIKSDFMNNMTHEFKTPLATISLAADSLLHPNTTLTSDNLNKYIGIIQNEKTKLNYQIERILEVASLSKDTLEIPLTSVNLNQSITSALTNLNLQIEKANAVIKVNTTENITALANQMHLENVLINLIENGLKYSDQTPKISIDLSVNNNFAILKIKDEGIGMQPQQIKKAFTDFYRVQSGNIHNSKGFGLGLSYSKLVIEKMKGSITLESKFKQGTTAIVKLKLP